MAIESYLTSFSLATHAREWHDGGLTIVSCVLVNSEFCVEDLFRFFPVISKVRVDLCSKFRTLDYACVLNFVRYRRPVFAI